MSLADQRPYEPGWLRRGTPRRMSSERSTVRRGRGLPRAPAVVRDLPGGGGGAARGGPPRLPAAAPQVQAPGALKRRVMSAVNEDAAREAGAGSRDAGAGSPTRSGAALRPVLAGLAVAAAVIALAVIAFRPRRRGRRFA